MLNFNQTKYGLGARRKSIVLIVILSLLALVAFIQCCPPSSKKGAAGDIRMHRRLANESEKPNVAPHEKNLDTFRILYIVTSGGKVYGGPQGSTGERFTNLVIPVIQETVQSILTRPDWSVDVYLVLGFEMDAPTETAIRNSLPPGVGLEIWNNAIPLGYFCKKWVSDPEVDPVGNGTQCIKKLSRRKEEVYENQTLAPLQQGGSQLARQHRYVVKDKLPFYDFLMHWEDDMVLHRHHIEHHLSWMHRIRYFQNRTAVEKPKNPSKDWGDAPSFEEWKRLRPGLIRVEGLQKGHRGTQRSLAVPVHERTTSNVNASLCCQTNASARNDGEISLVPVAKGSDLMLWEADVLGMGLRHLPETPTEWKHDNVTGSPGWIALLPGVHPRKRMHSFWPGNMLTPKPSKPGTCDPKYIAQSAGWMASPEELMEFHEEFCPGSFLPPFVAPVFQQDGFWRNNVEFWSGGIQLWCRCDIQRIVSLESDQEFSKHLIYHSSNNKQKSIPTERLVRVSNFLGQLKTAQEFLNEN